MKKVSLWLILALNVLMFGCQKEKPLSNKENLNAKEAQINERNSTASSWESLPGNLRNATQLSIENSSDAGKIAATYKYAIGPWGGAGGSAYAIYPLGTADKIYAIGIRSGAYVDALVVWYIRPDGTLYFYRVGGTGGTYYVQYLASNEYIYAVGGRSGGYLDRLSIYTNFKSFSYGGNGGAAFYRSVASGEQILGFFGGAGAYVDGLGGYVYTF